jgi:hypothetical protein
MPKGTWKTAGEIQALLDLLTDQLNREDRKGATTRLMQIFDALEWVIGRHEAEMEKIAGNQIHEIYESSREESPPL